MGKSVSFTREGRDYDVPVAEATILAKRLRDEADGDVTTAAGGLAVTIEAVIAGDSTTNVDLEGYETTSFVNAISKMIGNGETADRSALVKLRDAITSSD